LVLAVYQKIRVVLVALVLFVPLLVEKKVFDLCLLLQLLTLLLAVERVLAEILI
jgi:hypothetical protein